MIKSKDCVENFVLTIDNIFAVVVALEASTLDKSGSYDDDKNFTFTG